MLAEPDNFADDASGSHSPPPPDPSLGRSYGPRHLEVIEGLERIIFSEGFRDLTIGEMAERLQCSRRTLYEIAPSKEEIVMVVVDRVLRRVARRAHEAVAQETTSMDRIRAFNLSGLSELRQATLNFTDDVAESPAIRNHIAAHFRYAIGVGARLLSDGIAAGDFADVNPFLTAEMMDASLARLQDPRLLRSLGLSMAEAIEQFMHVFLGGLRLDYRGAT